MGFFRSEQGNKDWVGEEDFMKTTFAPRPVSLVIAFFLTLGGAVYFLSTFVNAQEKKGWKTDWERVIRDARREGELMVFVAGYQKFALEFQKAYPDIKLRAITGSGSSLSQRIMAERRAGRHIVDVYMGGSTSPTRFLHPAKALDSLKPLLVLPEVVDGSKWWGGKLHWVDSEDQYIVLYEGSGGEGSGGVAYNTELVKPGEIKSYWDLLNPKWKGKIAAFDPRGTGRGQSIRSIYFNKELGPKFLFRLFNEMNVTISVDQRTLGDWLARRVYAICLWCSDVGTLRDDLKQPVDTVEGLKEGFDLSSRFGSMAFLNRAPHPSAAKLFVNWALSREGQTAFQKTEEADSLRVDISKDGVDPDRLRKPGVRYSMWERAEYMDLKPAIQVINDALRKAGRR